MPFFVPTLEPLLALPPPSATTASFTSAIVIAVINVLFREFLADVVHRMRVPLYSLLVLARRRAWRAITTL